MINNESSSLNGVELFLTSYMIIIGCIAATIIYPIILLYIFITPILFVVLGLSLFGLVLTITKFKSLRKHISIPAICFSAVVIFLLSFFTYYEFKSNLDEVPSVTVIDNGIIKPEDLSLVISDPNSYVGRTIELDATVTEVYEEGLRGFKNSVIWNLIYSNSTWFEISFDYPKGYSTNAYVYLDKRMKNIQNNSSIKIKGIVLGETEKDALIFRPRKELFIRALEIE